MLILEAICHVWKCWQLVIFNPFKSDTFLAMTLNTKPDDPVTCNQLRDKIVDTNNVRY